MLINLLESLCIIIFLFFTEGLAEFLPISSSIHSSFLYFFLPYDNVATYIYLANTGTCIALSIYFTNEYITSGNNKKDLQDIWLNVFIVTAIVAVILYFLQGLKKYLQVLQIKYYCFIAFGLLLMYFARNLENFTKKSVTFKELLLIGLAQIIAALVPGVSRLGLTLTVAFTQKLEYKYSYILSMRLNLILLLIIIVKYFPGHYILIMNMPYFSTILLVTNIFAGIWFLYSLIKYYFKVSIYWFCIYRILIGSIALFI